MFFSVSGQTTTQVRAQVPVSRECTRDTERFLHFQERNSSCCTNLGTGRFCSNRWVTLKSREHTSTEGPGWLFSTGSRASILFTPPRAPAVSGRLHESTGLCHWFQCVLVPVDRQICAVCDGTVVQAGSLQTESEDDAGAEVVNPPF